MASIKELAVIAPFRIGTAEVRPDTREVLGSGGRVVLEPKVMQVLLLLAASKGEVVSRDTLVNECWEGRAVSEDAISRVIQRLRKMTDAEAKDAFAIKTVHKVGYRLVPIDANARSGSDVSLAPAEPSEEQIGRRKLLAVGAFLATGAAAAAWMFRGGSEPSQVPALIEKSEQAQRAGLTGPDAQGTSFLEKAVQLQPGNAFAWGRLALAHTLVAHYGLSEATAAAVAGAQSASAKALQIEPNQIDARSALAMLPPYYGAWLSAEARVKDVLSIDNDHLPTRDFHAFMLTAVGRVKEGASDRIAMAAMDPLHAIYQVRLVYAHWMLDQIDQADRAADRALLLWPQSHGAWLARFNTFALTGRPQRALAHIDDPVGRPAMPERQLDTLRATSIALESRKRTDIDVAANQLIEQVTGGPGQSASAIILLNGMGEVDRAFTVAYAYLLEEGDLLASLRWREGQILLGDHSRRMTNMLFLPCSAPMRADPRFATLVQRVGLTDYWTRSSVQPDYLL